MVNELKAAVSPYLLQHAGNPVDWKEWSSAAFAEARERNVPIFLSIGYAACHWCHVMAHESFEDRATAQILNERFVAVKVDREERPDIDSIYMEATTALTGHGGWPMSVFLDHEGRPFYAGTYFPPQPRGGMPSFTDVLGAIDRMWREKPAEVAQAASRIAGFLRDANTNVTNTPGATVVGEPVEEISLPDLLGFPTSGALAKTAVDKLANEHDDVHGGFGGAPKFPPSMVLDFLVTHYQKTKNPSAIAMVEKTCYAMARGGIYDQLGGGFARYSVDAEWVVPHFEKMLYDNALLLQVYAKLHIETGDELARRVALETADFMMAELLTEEGGFASSLDADSDGQEGVFYVWSLPELLKTLGETDGRWAADLLHVTADGSFEHGKSTLQLGHDPDDWARWEHVKNELKAQRQLRNRPGRDDKVVASWNSMAIIGLLLAHEFTDSELYVSAAKKAASLLRDVHIDKSGEMRRVSLGGKAGQPGGVLEDYAATALAFFALSATTGDPSWREIGDRLVDFALSHFVEFQDDRVLRFFDTSDIAEELFKRPQDLTDSATPAGSALMAQALAESTHHKEVALLAVNAGSHLMRTSPRFAGSWLLAAEKSAGPMCTVEGCD